MRILSSTWTLVRSHSYSSSCTALHCTALHRLTAHHTYLY